MSLLLDTNAVILMLQGSAVGPSGSDEKIAVSIITEIELLGWDGLSRIEEEAVRAFLHATTVLPLTEAVKEAAIELRRSSKLKTPDAIIAATAQVHGATLLTNDKRLLNVPGLRSRPLGIARATE